ncbi:MAG: OmpA family protein [Flavobacteriaceae bacterium]
MKNRQQNLIWCLVLLGGLLCAQNKQLEKAHTMYEDLAYIDAKDLYTKIADKGVEDADLFRKLGDVHYFNAKYKDAATWYAKALALDNNPPNDYNFRYGQALKATNQMQKADGFLQTFYDSKSVNYRPSSSYMDEIEKASGKHSIEKVNFNSEYSDYPGFLHDGELYVITADRSNKTNVWNEEPASDIYRGTGLDALDKPLNTKYNEGSLVITKDGQTIYFTRNDYINRKLGKDSQEVTRLKLLRSDKDDEGEWTKPKELPFNNSEYSVGHPALSPDEKQLYFVSDMPGGRGGTDLYVTEISEDNYSAPVNLTELNTVANEMFPFIDEEGTLYFSSNGHSNLGGLDVFFTKGNSDEGFDAPQNMGKPINSSYDDFAFLINEQTGYFASNRDNQNDDIYSFVKLEEIEEEVPCNVVFEGVVRDLKTGQPIPNANLVFVNGYLEEVGQVQADEQGRYSFQDEFCGNVTIIRANEEDYFPRETVVSGVDGGAVQTDIQLDKPDPIREAIETGTVTDLAIFIDPIYFDYGKSFIRPDASIELDKIVDILNDYPAMEIDVRSHTDSRSSSTFNMNLSDRRAKATIDYLVSKGINSNRLTGRGYGETQLVNHCSNGVQCSNDEHQQNRRSEFIITKK